MGRLAQVPLLPPKGVVIMSVGAVGGTGTSQWPSMAYLEAQLRRDQQRLWAHQSANKAQGIINADLAAIQGDRLAIARGNLRSTRLVGSQLTNQASYLLPTRSTSTAANRSEVWQRVDLYL